MRPGFREILPGMRTGVGADVGIAPNGRRTLTVMTLQRCVVVDALVAENGAKVIEPTAVAHQSIPVVMAHFVSEMADERPVGFAEGVAALLALRVIAFGNVQRDD